MIITVVSEGTLKSLEKKWKYKPRMWDFKEWKSQSDSRIWIQWLLTFLSKYVQGKMATQHVSLTQRHNRLSLICAQKSPAGRICLYRSILSTSRSWTKQTKLMLIGKERFPAKTFYCTKPSYRSVTWKSIRSWRPRCTTSLLGFGF